jgi:hypothetical protein
MAASKKVSVVLEKRDDKKSSVKFYTDIDTLSPDNIYIKNEVVEALGNPQKVKVTIEAA